MIWRFALYDRRRCLRSRRLFFCPRLATLVVLTTLGAGAVWAQDVPGARVLQRQVRVMRNEQGLYRVVDAMRVQLDADTAIDFTLTEPLALIQLQVDAEGVRAVGGDLPPGQVVYEPPDVAVVGPVNLRVFEVAVTYTLADDASLLVLTPSLPVENLLVEIDRATVEARPDASLSAAEPVGSETGRLLGYQAADLAAGQVVRLRLTASRVRWAQRIAVLIASILAAAAAGLVVWRRGLQRAPGT